MNYVAEIDHPMIDRRGRIDRRQKPVPRFATELEQAIELGTVEVLFQPQFLCADGSLAGAEALLRWYHPDAGELSGDRVFELAKEAGLAGPLTRYLCQAAMSAATKFPEAVRLSLNATPDDLADESYPGVIRESLSRSGFPASRLTLEITEQALVDRLDVTATVLRQMVNDGISIALDDFGAGFCNFRYLKVLPLAALKLDRSMVEGIATDRQDLAVFRAIMAMAHALDLRVIAEGVETEAQRKAVCREGCDRWQGFLGAKPLSASEFAALQSFFLPGKN
ncbi:EAL domain-containing protein [Parerythrobacter lacustris]|uniref:EAL domain-containing protein n=1 Tax=Parerythrobacter lacustris TaxID=2969984 RepID=A0ABT1XR05_9SPHN|nr:EAL domain-containing protein [Parerythrobacter lacustris]MCR2834042.1 EAL domain-containing protein [Parerythrobacter lacustris]